MRSVSSWSEISFPFLKTEMGRGTKSDGQILRMKFGVSCMKGKWLQNWASVTCHVLRSSWDVQFSTYFHTANGLTNLHGDLSSKPWTKERSVQGPLSILTLTERSAITPIAHHQHYSLVTSSFSKVAWKHLSKITLEHFQGQPSIS